MDAKVVFGAIKGKTVIAYRQADDEVEIKFDDDTVLIIREDGHYDYRCISVIETPKTKSWLY